MCLFIYFLKSYDDIIKTANERITKFPGDGGGYMDDDYYIVIILLVIIWWNLFLIKMNVVEKWWDDIIDEELREEVNKQTEIE